MTTDLEALATLLEQAGPESQAELAVYDQTGRKIMVGDVLKVYHFTGARWRKRYFMYKQVVAETALGPSGKLYLLVSHLNMKDAAGNDGGYYIAQDGQIEREVEIVQGLDWHHERPRLAAACLRAAIAEKES